MTKEETIQVLESIEDRAVDFPNMTACDWVAIAAAKRHLSNYIDKSTLITEIKNIKKYYLEREEFDLGWNKALEKILSFLNVE